MAPSSISRGPITSRLLDELATEGFPVGDNAQPTSPFGWQGSRTNQGLPSLPGSPCLRVQPRLQAPSGALGDSQSDWRLSYSVVYAGISRKQTEALADRMRMNLTNIARENVDSDTGAWRIQKITCTTIGNTNRIGSAYPDYFTQADSFEVWVTKG